MVVKLGKKLRDQSEVYVKVQVARWRPGELFPKLHLACDREVRFRSSEAGQSCKMEVAPRGLKGQRSVSCV